MDKTTTHEQVQRYYGEVLGAKGDLQTNACCCAADGFDPRLRPILDQIEPVVLERFYGCGSPIPDVLAGRTVLDLGCGTGRDAFVCSKLVGESGTVIAVDMTPQQLEVGRKVAEAQALRFGHSRSNVNFIEGYMEDLGGVGIEDSSVDVVISNCVINLSPNKEQVFREIFRVLKPGGELFFSDVFSDRRVPHRLHEDQELLGECLAGAMYIQDFRRMLQRCGVNDFSIFDGQPMTIENPKLAMKIGMVGFSSLTVRAFNISSLEDRCEDYGQLVKYLGDIEGAPHAYQLDDQQVFETGRPEPVCGNTASTLSESRFATHFEIIGDRSTHYGMFEGRGTSTAAMTQVVFDGDDGESADCCCG